MKDNLFNKYNENKDYYRCNEDAKEDLLNNFTHDKACQFINDYFALAGKDGIFNLDFINDYKIKGKHIHTVSLFFLGLSLKEMVTSIFNNQIGEIVSDHTKNTLSYIWFLCCLFHDTACVVENDQNILSRGNNVDLDFFLGKYNIKYNLFEHQWDNIKMYNYSESLVNNYFKYRLDDARIDHGILGGYLLYDRLRKNYDEKFIEHNALDYNCFGSNGLCWEKFHHHYYAIAAHTIIEHNIWLASDKRSKIKYKKYGLNELIPQENDNRKININKSPLPFYFGLLDTIEPLKVFQQQNAKTILEHIDVSYQGNKMIITWDEEISNKQEFKTWHKDINNATSWLDVSIVPLNENKQNGKIAIKINP